MGSRRVLAVLALLGAAAAVPVYVMLPLDLINLDGSVNDIGQLQSDLGALAGAGVKGVMSDVWWGIAERAGPKAYNFSGYGQVIEVVAAAHLEFQAVMSFHQCGGNVGDACDIPLPGWVTGATGEDVWYEDAEGNKDMEYISLCVCAPLHCRTRGWCGCVGVARPPLAGRECGGRGRRQGESE
jgi:beta-amylase